MSRSSHPGCGSYSRSPDGLPPARRGGYGGYTFGHGGRQIRFAPIAFWSVVGGLAIMAAWSLVTATYFAFREDVLARLIARQAHMQYADEDRIADLRTQVDRLAGRQLLNQEQFEQKLEGLLRRQSVLGSRVATLPVLPLGAGTGGGEAFCPAGSGRDRLGQASAPGGGGSPLGGVPQAGRRHAGPGSAGPRSAARNALARNGERLWSQEGRAHRVGAGAARAFAQSRGEPPERHAQPARGKLRRQGARAARRGRGGRALARASRAKTPP